MAGAKILKKSVTMKKIAWVVLTIGLVIVTGCQRELTSYVNPFVGSDFHGHTFPGCIYPYGQIQPGPDTRLGGWDGCSGYHYSDDTLYGFSHTHLNGTGCEDLCDVLLMPVQGKAPKQLTRETYLTTFSHNNESAEPGYYTVKMDNGIVVELTCNERVAYHRYTFPGDGEKGFIIDLTHRDKLIDGGFIVRAKENNKREFQDESDEVSQGDKWEIAGWRESNSWNPDQHCFFAIHVETPRDEIVYYDAEGCVADSSTAVKMYIPLDTKSNSITVEVALSGVDVEGAKKNLVQSNKGTFDEVRKNTHEEWEQKENADTLALLQKEKEEEAAEEEELSLKLELMRKGLTDAQGKTIDLLNEKSEINARLQALETLLSQTALRKEEQNQRLSEIRYQAEELFSKNGRAEAERKKCERELNDRNG